MKSALIALGLFSLVSLGHADSYNLGVSQTATGSETDPHTAAQLMGWDSVTNAWRLIKCDSNGNILISSGGGASQAVSVNPGTNYIGAVGVTNTVVNQWTLLSITTRTITAPVLLNLTTVAGSSGVMMYRFSSSNTGTGFVWSELPNSTYVAPISYYATNTTPIQDDYKAAGTHLVLSPSSATDISITAQLLIWKLSTVAP